MIPRYARPEMAAIWQDENKFQIWLDIETYACEAQAELGEIPKEAVKDIQEKGAFEISRIGEIEKEVKHDVIAFLTNVAEHVGDNARYIHKGLTSSDILDTCLAVQLSQSADILLNDLDKLLAALQKRATEQKNTLCMGRSHGIHAEPTTFGLKLATYYAEFERNKKRLQQAKEEIATCALSGAVGTFAHISPKVESYVAGKMGLAIEPISTQVIPRDRHAVFFSTLGIIASSIERLAVEIRHLQRTEVLEVQEYFDKGQKGSSAMPHKKNPILSENLTGLARIVRMAVTPAMENITLWHERDISHSSVERMIAPDTTITLDFALHRLTELIENLLVYPENMLKNMEKFGGLTSSQRVLLALTQEGVSRENAYRIVQKNAMEVWENGGHLKDLLEKDTDVTNRLNKKELTELFDDMHHLKNVEVIFERVFGKSNAGNSRQRMAG
jgi:adenylosuccinate lyase